MDTKNNRPHLHFNNFTEMSVNSLQGQLMHAVWYDFITDWGNSPDKLPHPRSDAYSAQQVLLNKQQIWCGGAYLDNISVPSTLNTLIDC